MARYIDADNLHPEDCALFGSALVFAIKMIDDAATADVAPVVHAHWEWFSYDSTPGIGNLHCSKCNGISFNGTAYCPHCGAKMD